LSIAAHYGLAVNDCAAKLVTYFKNLGADMVVDMTLADDFALLESQREFIRRFRATESDGVKNVIPMLASSCPGWVCYAEKTHGSYILPYISTTKSPQQIMGSLIKHWVGHNLGDRAIYHVTLMPCYDKKLEAAREDFFNSETQSRDVDCVLTASNIPNFDFKFLLSPMCYSRTAANAGKGGLQLGKPRKVGVFATLVVETRRRCRCSAHQTCGFGFWGLLRSHF
jgi:iron only hydrogenase large subunit-like protein